MHGFSEVVNWLHTRHASIRVVCMTMLATVIVSCSSSIENSREEAPTVTASKQPPFAYYSASEDSSLGYDALLVGVFEYSEGCLYIRQVDFDKLWLPIFPESATWDESVQSLTLKEVTVSVGTVVSLRGGEVSNSSTIDHLPRTCELKDNLWLTSSIRPSS